MAEGTQDPAHGAPQHVEGPGSEGASPAVPEAPKRSKALPIGVAVAVIAAAAGVGAFFMLKGGQPKAETPQAALQGFYKALNEGDCTTAAAYADPSWATEAQVCKQINDWKKTEGTLGKIASSQVDGSSAYVVASRTVGGVTDQRIMTVNRSGDGTWRYAGNSACYGEESPEDLGNVHLDAGETFAGYSNPPSSGPHSSTASEMGTIFRTEQPSEQLVHSLEHGAVVFWSNLQGPLAKTAEENVIDVYDQGYSNLIITPKTDLDVPFAMSAWGSVQKCVGVDAAAIQRFVDTHYAQGIEGFMACFDEKAAGLPGCAKAL